MTTLWGVWAFPVGTLASGRHHHTPPVWGFVTRVFMYSVRGLSPLRELHDRCAGLSGPVMLPPVAMGSMWSAVKALRSVYGAV